MSIKYFGKEIEEHERKCRGPFIGYINPQGMLINYSRLLGPKGHDNWRNPATIAFLSNISYVLADSNIDRYKNCDIEFLRKKYEKYKYKGSIDIPDEVIRGFNFTTHHYNSSSYEEFVESVKKKAEMWRSKGKLTDVYEILTRDLMGFFEKCYSYQDFFYTLGRIIKVPSLNALEEIYSWADKDRREEI